MSCSCTGSFNWKPNPYKNKGQEKLESSSSEDVSRIIVQRSKTVIKDLGKYNDRWAAVSPRDLKKWEIQVTSPRKNSVNQVVTSTIPRNNSVNQDPKMQFLTVPGVVPESDLPQVKDRFRVWPNGQNGDDFLAVTILSADKDGVLFQLDEPIENLTEMFFKMRDWKILGKEKIDPA